MKKILIIGLGEFGKHTARKFQELKNEVCIVDIRHDIINRLSDEFPNAYVGDCMQLQTLREIGVKNFDICVVAVGANFQASLEITSNLKELHASYIISKAASELQAKFLKMAGANETVYPEKDIAEKIAIKHNTNDLFDYIKLSKDYNVSEIKILKSWTGKTIRELDIRNHYNVNILAVKTNDEIILPSRDYCFNDDDHVYLFGKDEDIFRLEKRNK